MTEEIVELAMALGQRTEADRARMTALCRAAELELEGRLRDGLRCEDCGRAFPTAAAWMALAADGEENVESFTAGDLTIRGAEGTQQSRERRALAERLMAPYLKDEGFCFQGVRG